VQTPTQKDSELRSELEQLCNHYPERRGALLPILHRLQQDQGHLTLEDLVLAAEMTKLSPAEVFSVTSFYTMFRLRPAGRRPLGVCRNISCWLCGAEELTKRISDELSIQTGETTADGEFSLEEVECLGSCGTGPVLEVNGRYFENLSPEEIPALLNDLRGQDLDAVHTTFCAKKSTD
jgi:NADH-quinone oxidoreductase subunit E